MSNTSDKQIVFYDIASAPPATTFAPNPWKTRYALNFKGVSYRTEWVELPDVTDVRKKLGAEPNRKHRDGSDFYTLPVIQDHSTGRIVGDTFEIALYLDEAYPNAPRLIPAGTVGVYAAFNIQVDAVFTNHTVLCMDCMPFNPATADKTKATFAWRAGKASWDEMLPSEEARSGVLTSFEAALGGLVKCYRRLDEGPFLEGAKPTYADLIVGGWLAMMKRCLRSEEWKQLEAWHGGLWGNIDKALEKYAEVK
jgi:glutathione S-transferase